MQSTLERSQAADAQLEQYDRDGYFVARGLFAPDEIEEIRRVFAEQSKDGPVEGLSDVPGGAKGLPSSDPLSRYPRMMHPADHPELPVGPLAMRYMLDSRLYERLRVLMRDEPIAAQSMFYFKPPGARGQAMHQDNYYLRVHPGTCMAAWIAIDDCDVENGAMEVVPGTHTMEVVCPTAADNTKYFTSEHVEIPGATPVLMEMKAGDVLFFNGSLVHGSPPNTSPDRFRRALIFHYIPEQSDELAQWYANPRHFDGTRVTVAHSTGGGPCGTLQAAQMGVH